MVHIVERGHAGPKYHPPSEPQPNTRLHALLSERRVRVFEKHLEILLMPKPSLRGRLEGVLVAAELVEAVGGRVAGAVRLTTGLHPDERVAQIRASLGRETLAKAGAFDVAPVWGKGKGSA